MKNPFKKSAALSEAERALKSWGIKYKKKADGSISVAGNLDISHKNLTQLPDLSQVIVGGSFFCSDNLLTSLAGAPQSVGGHFFCSRNQLKSLEGAPNKFTMLGSDFGNFPSWEAVPEQLRTSPETKSRLEQDRARERATAMDKEVQATTVLQAPIKVGAPFKFKRRPPT